MTTVWLRGGRVVTPDRVLSDAGVLVADGRIAAVTAGSLDLVAPHLGAPPEIVELAGHFVLPGFLDLHVHGGGGAGFDDGAAAIATGLAVHRANGTTRNLISLMTAPPERMLAAVEAAAEHAYRDPSVLGLHLEGPFLAVDRRGAHDPRWLRDPNPALLERLLAAGRGLVQVVTMAPELPGGPDLLRRLRDADVRVAVGHTDATYSVAMQAFSAGAQLVTHAFNGMRPMHHREPGVIGAAMDAGVVLEAVNDGVHLHPATLRLLHALAPGRLALVTDAMAATGAPDGPYRLGALDVHVIDGEARLPDGTLAGSTLTMASAVRRAVQQVGMSVVEAANAASLVPATLLAVAERYGSIRPGRAADLVIADDDLIVRAVMIDGRWVDSRRP